MKTGIVESVQGNGGFETKYGYMFSFEYKIEGGDFGVANHKTEQAKYKAGDTVHYDVEEDQYGVKLKFGNPDFPSPGNTPTTQSNTPQVKSNDMVTGIALKYATMVKCAYIAKGADFDEGQLKAELEMMKRLMS